MNALAQAYAWAKRIDWRLPSRRAEMGGFTPRDEWGEGPWNDEPDRIEWRHESGLPLLMVRGPTGSWCGYVGVPGPHAAFGHHYDRVEEQSAHGGLTFAGECHGAICHQAEPGEPERVWWFGFDCAHAGDVSPALQALTRKLGLGYGMPEPSRLHERWEVYRHVDYVRGNVEELAAELAAHRDFRRERWWWFLVTGWKLLARRDLPEMWRAIYLERDRMDRGPEERAYWEQLESFGSSVGGGGTLTGSAAARRRDRLW